MQAAIFIYRIKKLALILSCILTSLLFPNFIYSETYVNQDISTNALWTQSNSPYIISSDITVLSGVELRIEAGVDVKFGNRSNLIIKGKIIAKGNFQNKVNFLPLVSTTNKAVWGSLIFDKAANSLGSELRYCNFENGGRQEHAPIIIDGTCNPSIEQISFNNNFYNGLELLNREYQEDISLNIRNIPYLILKSLTIHENRELRINPGVILKLKEKSDINIYGKIRAIGEPESMIVFTSIFDDSEGIVDSDAGGASIGTPLDWGGIIFYEESAYSGSILNNCHFKYGAGAGESTNSLIRTKGSDPLIEYCKFEESGFYGIYITESPVPDLGLGKHNSKGNNIFNHFENHKYAIYNRSSSTVSAKHNCWNKEVNEIPEIIFDKHDRSDFGEVIYDPFKDFCGPVKPNQVFLISPKNNTENLNVNLVFNWQKEELAESYRIQISNDESYTDLIIDKYSVSDTFFVSPLLNYSKDYYWRVKAINPFGESVWSEHRKFKTIDSTVPEKAILISPSNNAINQTSAIYFTWKHDPSALAYEIMISKDKAFTDLVHHDDTVINNYIDLSSFESEMLYYWKVRAYNNIAKGEWSESFAFSCGEWDSYPPPQSWKVTTKTGSNTSILVRSDVIEKLENNISINKGDAIGVFFEKDSLLICGGYSVWENSNTVISVWGDNTQTPDIKDGFVNNEEFRFIIWDAENQEEIPVTVELESGLSFYRADTMSVISKFRNLDSFEIDLSSKRWKFVSSPVSPFFNYLNYLDIENIVISDIDKNEYNSIDNKYSLKQWNFQSGYKAFKTDNNGLILKGNLINTSAVSLKYNAGKQVFFPSLFNHFVKLSDVFQNHQTKVLFLMDDTGNFYYPDGGIDNIEYLSPGKAYLMFPKEDINMQFDQYQIQEDIVFDHSFNYFTENIFNSGKQCVYIIENNDFKNGDEIALFNNEQKIVGKAKCGNKNTIICAWGKNDYPASENTAKNGEELYALHWEKETGNLNTLNISSSFNYISQQYGLAKLSYNNSYVYKIKSSKATGIIADNNKDNIIFTYDKKKERIELEIKDNDKHNIIIYNLLGQIVISKQDKKWIDCSKLSAGKYFVRIVSNNQSESFNFVKE